MNRPLSIVCLFACLAYTAMAETRRQALNKVSPVIKQSRGLIYLRHPFRFKYNPLDRLCFHSLDEDKDLGCGTVVKVRKKWAKVRVPKDFPRVPRNVLIEPITYKFNYKHIATAGVLWGLNFFFPNVHYQYKFERNLTVGFLPHVAFFTLNNVKVRMLGGAVTLNVVNTDFLYKNFWAMFGLGLETYRVTAFTTENKMTPVAFGTFGWRGQWKSGLTAGVGLGLLYAKPNTTLVTLRLNGINLFSTLDVGLYF